jgi:hypothetical protein
MYFAFLVGSATCGVGNGGSIPSKATKKKSFGGFLRMEIVNFSCFGGQVRSEFRCEYHPISLVFDSG